MVKKWGCDICRTTLERNHWIEISIYLAIYLSIFRSFYLSIFLLFFYFLSIHLAKHNINSYLILCIYPQVHITKDHSRRGGGTWEFQPEMQLWYSYASWVGDFYHVFFRPHLGTGSLIDGHIFWDWFVYSHQPLWHKNRHVEFVVVDMPGAWFHWFLSRALLNMSNGDGFP